jgi:molybdopterin-binding protein
VSVSQVGELASLRNEVEGIARDARQVRLDSGGQVVATSYSLGVVGGILTAPQEKIVAIVDAIKDSVKETLAKLAPVAHFETTVDGFTAKTAINYSGFAVSVWSGGTTWELVDAHLESLRTAYAFRAAVTGVVAAVGNALVAISIAVGNPLTVWHAVKSAEALKLAVDRLAASVATHAQSASAIS